MKTYREDHFSRKRFELEKLWEKGKKQNRKKEIKNHGFSISDIVVH